MNEHDLTALLREVPVPASRLTSDHAISLGRKATRRRRRSRTAAAAIAVVAATTTGFTLARPAPPPPAPLTFPSASPSPTPAAPVDWSRWTATPLPLPIGAAAAEVRAMDSSGRYIVGVTDTHKLILWVDLVPRLLPVPGIPPSQWPLAVDVNASGAVVFNVVSSAGAWVYRDGEATRLAGAAGGSYQARDINDRGDILTWSPTSGMFVWPAGGSGNPRPVSALDSVFALGEDGSVGGRAGEHPVVVGPDGQARHLPRMPDGTGGEVFHISGDWACGWVSAANGPAMAPARWHLPTGELTTYPEAEGNCTGMSSTGAFLAVRRPLKQDALITPDGIAITMPTGSKPGETVLHAINAGGTAIAGNLSVTTGSGPVYTPMLWRRTA